MLGVAHMVSTTGDDQRGGKSRRPAPSMLQPSTGGALTDDGMRMERRAAGGYISDGLARGRIWTGWGAIQRCGGT